MKRFRIVYRDLDPACPQFSTTIRAYDRTDAEVRFLDAEDGDGWQIISISEARPSARVVTP